MEAAGAWVGGWGWGPESLGEQGKGRFSLGGMWERAEGQVGGPPAEGGGGGEAGLHCPRVP